MQPLGKLIERTQWSNAEHAQEFENIKRGYERISSVKWGEKGYISSA